MLPASRASRERGQGTALEPSQGIASPAPLLWYVFESYKGALEPSQGIASPAPLLWYVFESYKGALEPSQGMPSPAPLLWYVGNCIPCTPALVRLREL